MAIWKNEEYKFAFLVHSRNSNDLSRKFKWVKYLPTFLLDFLTLTLSPIEVSKITGLIGKDDKPIKGVVIGIPMTAKQLIENRTLALKKIIKAVNLAKSKGANFIGLGAMTASLSRGGNDVIETIPDVTITTGRTYTINNIVKYIEYCVNKFNLDSTSVRVGIVGAAGGIGSGVAIALAKSKFRHFVLIDLERKLENLKKTIVILEKDMKDLTIEISHKVSSIKNCNIIIAATSAPEVVITSKDVNPGTIIINDAQPSDISPEIVSSRPDVLVIEGGVVKTNNIDCHINFGLHNKTDIFSCLAETLLLAFEDSKEHYSINGYSYDFMSQLKKDGDKLGFSISPLQNDRGLISEKQIEEFGRIIQQRSI